MTLRELLAVTWLLLFVGGISVVLSSEILFESLRFEITDPTYVSDYNLKLVPFKKRKVLNGTATIAKTVDSFTMELIVVVPRPKGNDMKFLNMTLDGCSTISGDSKTNLVNLIMSEFRKTKGFFPNKCPLQAGQTLFIDHMFVSASSLPMYMMEFVYDAQLNLLIDGKYVLKNFMKGSVVSHNQMG